MRNPKGLFGGGSGLPPGFAAAIAKAIDNGALDAADDQPPASASSQVLRLREIGQRYMNVLDRLKVGDLATFDKSVPGHLKGQPCLIVDLMPDAAPQFVSDVEHSPMNDPDFGARYDVRIMHIDSGGIVHCHWVESWQLVPFVDPNAGFVLPHRKLTTTFESVWLGGGGPKSIWARFKNKASHSVEVDIVVRGTDDELIWEVSHLGIAPGGGQEIPVPVNDSQTIQIRASVKDLVTLTLQEPTDV